MQIYLFKTSFLIPNSSSHQFVTYGKVTAICIQTGRPCTTRKGGALSAASSGTHFHVPGSYKFYSPVITTEVTLIFPQFRLQAIVAIEFSLGVRLLFQKKKYEKKKCCVMCSKVYIQLLFVINMGNVWFPPMNKPPNIPGGVGVFD